MKLRSGLVNLLLLVSSVLACLLGLELVLRWRPTLLGETFATGALSRYTTRPGGIYYADRKLRMVFMIPNTTAPMYTNGYVWTHRTDALGFRNETVHVPADAILLGDSIVYGQGVDFPDTIGANLARLAGLRVMNLGQQGNCAWQEAYGLHAHIDVFKPAHVVYVFSPNDITDAYEFLSDAAMEAFIDTPIDQIRWPPRTDVQTLLALREAKNGQRSIWKRIEQEAYVFKVARWVRFELRRRWPAMVAAAEAKPGRPRAGGDVTLDPTSLGWRYTDKAIAYMAELARARGARFVVVPTVSGPQFEILREIAARRHLPFVNTLPDMADASAWLPRDGHLSPHGARRLAELIAEDLRAAARAR